MSENKLSENMVSDFCAYLKSEEKSTNTIEKYLRDVKMFMMFIGGEDVTKERVVEYKNRLISEGYAVSSINSMIASVNCFFAFLHREDLKVKPIRHQQQIYCREEKELTKAEYMRLIKAAKRSGKERLNLLIQTICATGIRVSELEYITVEAVAQGKAVVRLKGKTRVVFIVRDLQKKLLCYAKRLKITKGPVFITRSGRPVSRTNIWREMKALCVQADVNPQKVFPHNLRHLFARVFYGIEKDIAKLADILGHSSINTTRIYVATTGNEHRRQLEFMVILFRLSLSVPDALLMAERMQQAEE